MFSYARPRSTVTKGVLGILLLFASCLQVRAETPQADIFIGTLSVDQGEVILTRCDIANNRYVLRDDAQTNSNAVAGYLAQQKDVSGLVYAEVYGRYFDAQGRSGLDVLEIDNLTPGRDCHLLSAIDTLLEKAGETGSPTALWLGPTSLEADDITHLAMDFDHNGMPVLDIAFSAGAGERLSVMTGQQVGRELDLRLNGRLIERVVLAEPIHEGRLRLSGRYSVAEIKQLMRDMVCVLHLSEATVPSLSKSERRCP